MNTRLWHASEGGIMVHKQGQRQGCPLTSHLSSGLCLRQGGVVFALAFVVLPWHPRITAESCEVVCCQHSRAVAADVASMGSSSSSFASADVVCMTWQRSRQGWGGLFDGCRRCW